MGTLLCMAWPNSFLRDFQELTFSRKHVGNQKLELLLSLYLTLPRGQRRVTGYTKARRACLLPQAYLRLTW